MDRKRKVAADIDKVPSRSGGIRTNVVSKRQSLKICYRARMHGCLVINMVFYGVFAANFVFLWLKKWRK